MPLHYLHYDVFTSEPLVGNQLAVFTDADGLSTVRMQRIAREMNFSESTFILPAEIEGTDIRMRIFTPRVEMPMAGHPTVGSAFALVHAGIIRRGTGRVVFGLNVGPTPVDLEWQGERLRSAWMTQRSPAFGPPIAARARVAGALGLSLEDVVADLPIQQVSCGVPCVLIPLRDAATVDRAVCDPAAIAGLEMLPPDGRVLFLFSVSASAQEATVHSRMFAPALGVNEDPATGSASGPLGCYLLEHRIVSSTAARNIVSHQGVAMGRPSQIRIAISGEPGAITQVKVGGDAVLVARGEMLV